ncbi:ABC transporter permease [Spongiactinospora sp. 9N601]|uniref:ABC transporter permease n=1 Tax=Spongiactinospora sp. 9N601 TaxID=3375149 RepID=UPI0037A6D897
MMQGALRPVFALVAANLRRHARDRIGLFFIVVMPFLAIAFVGLAMGGAATGKVRLPVGVVAQDSDPVATAVLEQMRGHPDLDIVGVAGEQDMRDRVRTGELAGGLVIRPGSTRLDMVVTQSNGSGLAAQRTVGVAVGRVAAMLEATRAARAAGATESEAAAYVRAAQADAPDVEVANTSATPGTPRGFAYTAPANLLLFTFLNSMAVAAGLAESRALGVIRRSLAAPVREWSVLLGETVSRFVIAVAQAAMIMVVSALLFDVSWGDPLGTALVVVAFCLVATGAAVLVGSLVRSPSQAPAIGPPLGIVLGMLGGCLWPKEVAGEPLTTIGYLFPHAWGMDALLVLTRPGAGVRDVVTELAVLAGMAAALLAIALAVFRRATREN